MPDQSKLKDVNDTLKDVELDLLRRKVDRQDQIIANYVSDEGGGGDAKGDEQTGEPVAAPAE